MDNFYNVEKPLNPHICTDKQWKLATDLCICVDIYSQYTDATSLHQTDK